MPASPHIYLPYLTFFTFSSSLTSHLSPISYTPLTLTLTHLTSPFPIPFPLTHTTSACLPASLTCHYTPASLMPAGGGLEGNATFGTGLVYLKWIPGLLLHFLAARRKRRLCCCCCCLPRNRMGAWGHGLSCSGCLALRHMPGAPGNHCREGGLRKGHCIDLYALSLSPTTGFQAKSMDLFLAYTLALFLSP